LAILESDGDVGQRVWPIRPPSSQAWSRALEAPDKRHEEGGNCGMAEPYVTVCACTYRRPRGLRALLGGLAAQRFEDARPDFDVVIVDNEGSAEARAICAEVGRATGLAVRYVQEPRHGIPYARNACLDQVAPATAFFAMIDDDEVPEPAWLEQLIRAQGHAGADVVRGPVVPVFPDGAPAWIRDGDFFGWPKQRRAGVGTALADGAELASASSNNVLVRAAAVRALGLRFDTTLTFTGGTDALFFRQMKLAGCRIVYAAGARVREAVPPQRATFRYLWRVHYKLGCNKVPRKLRLEAKGAGASRFVRMAVKRLPRECAEIGGGALAVARSLVGGDADMGRLSPGLLRIAKGLGGLAGLIGVRFPHYR
jgi:glycosyltransferase involved in cell wall biosynthesis